MRTKTTLLLTAAIVAAGVASSMAQSNVYSLNIVGYVNLPVVANNFYLLTNPLDTGDGDPVSTVIPIQDPNFDSSEIFTFTQSGGLNAVELFIGGFGWGPGTNVLKPGTGFYLFATETTNLTFVGSVTLSNSIALPPGFSLVGSAYPASTNLVALGINGTDSDEIFRFSQTGGLNDISQNIGGFGWAESVNGVPVGGTGGSTNGFSPNIAEGFFYFNANSPFTWSQSFTVN